MPPIETSTGLLIETRDMANAKAWQRLVNLYTPFLVGILRRQGLQYGDCEDLVQEVFAVLARELLTFQHNGNVGAFRNWLRQVLANRLKDFQYRDRRAPPPSSEVLNRLAEHLADANSELGCRWNQEHNQYLIQQLLARVRPQVSTSVWQAFELQHFQGLTAPQVATRLQLTIGTVYNARHTVLNLLRREVDAHFLEESA